MTKINIKTTFFFIFLFFTSSVIAQIQYRVITDDEVVVKDGYIIRLTQKGIANLKNKNIEIPDYLQGQKIIGLGGTRKIIYDGEEKIISLFDSIGTGFLRLPTTIEHIGPRACEHRHIDLKEFPQNYKNLKKISFQGIRSRDSISKVIDFSNLKNIETLGLVSVMDNPAAETITFENSSIKKIGFWTFFGTPNLKNVNLNGCTSLSLLLGGAFTGYGKHKLNKPDLSSCVSLIYVGNNCFGLIKDRDEKDTTLNFTSYELPTPKIKGLTFVSWYNTKGEDIDNTVNDFNVSYFAKFKECAIFIDEHLHNGTWDGTFDTTKMLKPIVKEKKEKKEKKTFRVIFIIRNHSIQQVNISAIKTTNGGTLSWQKGTIKTGEMQQVVVTYPAGTTDYTNTISIEGPGLKGNTTVKISKTGETTTDNNMLSSVAQEQLAREQNKLLSVYPNPAVSELHISYSKPQESYRVKIISLQGKTMYQNNRFEGTAVDISHLPPAVYLIQVNESVQTFIKH